MREALGVLMAMLFVGVVCGLPVLTWQYWHRAPRGALNAMELHILDTGEFPDDAPEPEDV